ncbi:MAG: L-histidine N(alpha)-methyltransferase, partial [Pseudomonadota bacterium]
MTELQRAAARNEGFALDVLAGLGSTPKTLPSRWLYDRRGSELFELITELPEYYPTRTETGILRAIAGEVAQIVGPGARLVEYGAGASTKTRILLDALPDLKAYQPIDISSAFLAETAASLAADYPDLVITPIAADFMQPVDIDGLSDKEGRVVGFFPGSTIGNLDDDEIAGFLGAARETLGPSALFLLGADLRKSPDILIPAYDDQAGVTAEFNLNLLVRINRELDGDFDLANFTHQARWNDAESRIEMHLVCEQARSVDVLGQTVQFAAGETIHTDNSRKFRVSDLDRMAASGGWTLDRT